MEIEGKALLALAMILMILLFMTYSNVCKQNKEMFAVSEENKITSEDENSPFTKKIQEVIPPWTENKNNYGELDMLDDGMNGNGTLTFNMCSKSCCSTQYPPPIDMPVDPLICNSKQKFVSSSYTCNNGWQDTGCVCMTEKQAELLARRGYNM